MQIPEIFNYKGLAYFCSKRYAWDKRQFISVWQRFDSLRVKRTSKRWLYYAKNRYFKL
jgi:hypothetical protein